MKGNGRREKKRRKGKHGVRAERRQRRRMECLLLGEHFIFQMAPLSIPGSKKVLAKARKSTRGHCCTRFVDISPTSRPPRFGANPRLDFQSNTGFCSSNLCTFRYMKLDNQKKLEVYVYNLIE